ncbi:Integrase core domain protein [Pelotomaculum schinkii]|uniref:Integrase core domain protein n=2 Tax=Pelotomaculum schinkii TaxID=78350 RepID=A0A4Y7RCB5_9FIRM|nr:Integrase core domain protein [Pelotomaculum schinkii]TEB09905.1 Integrase core domain protein [Pelotomaculum sp. FP]
MALTEEQKMEVALFRFGLIAPLLNNQVDNPKVYLEKVSALVYDVPYYGRKEFCDKTFRRWLLDYRKDNLEGLKPQNRKDKGQSRVISEDLAEKIIAFRHENPGLSVMLLYDQMAKEGLILRSEVSYHSVYRFLKKKNLAKPLADKVVVKDRKRFAYDEVNRMWQGDMMTGPYVIVNGKKKPTYLFAFIDDCSRLVTFAQFSFEQNFDAMKKVYIEAVIRRGIPKIVYLDNGKVYRSQLFHWACAQMGTTVSHTEPFDAPSKGKIERIFRTVRERFLPLLSYPVTSLDELNRAFGKWLEEDYHRRVHSSLGMSPLDKYLSLVNQVKFAREPDLVRELFLKRESRRVHNDATVSIGGRLFEVPPALIGQKVEVRFEPNDLSKILIYANDKFVGKGLPVQLADNARMKRNRSENDISPQVLSFHEALLKKESGK